MLDKVLEEQHEHFLVILFAVLYARVRVLKLNQEYHDLHNEFFLGSNGWLYIVQTQSVQTFFV